MEIRDNRLPDGGNSIDKGDIVTIEKFTYLSTHTEGRSMVSRGGYSVLLSMEEIERIRFPFPEDKIQEIPPDPGIEINER